MDHGCGARKLAHCELELSVGSANVRTLSPATDELEVHSVRTRVQLMLWVRRRRTRAIRLSVFVVVFTWSPRLPCLGREVGNLGPELFV